MEIGNLLPVSVVELQGYIPSVVYKKVRSQSSYLHNSVSTGMLNIGFLYYKYGMITSYITQLLYECKRHGQVGCSRNGGWKYLPCITSKPSTRVDGLWLAASVHRASYTRGLILLSVSML